jgi:hypothetical protein
MSKFAYCYEADGLMWCVYPNGVHAAPFLPQTKKSGKQKTTPKKEE